MLNRVLFFSIQAFLAVILLLAQPVFMLLSIFSDAIKKRLEFELSYPQLEGHYDAIFEVASEGEVEQIAPVMEGLLHRNRRILLLFASQSAQKKAENLSERFPDLTVAALPLMTFSTLQTSYTRTLSRLRTGQVFFCRYDFYPHLILLGRMCGDKSYLLSASLKNKKLFVDQLSAKDGVMARFGLGLKRWYWRQQLLCFSAIFCAGASDRKKFELLLAKKTQSLRLEVFDFRQVQILHRLQKTDERLKNQWPVSELFGDFLSSLAGGSAERSLILGSAWAKDLNIFTKEWSFRENLTVVAPHLLSPQALDDFINQCHQRIPHHPDIPVYHWRQNMTLSQAREVIGEHFESPGLHLISVPGILCELYSLFKNSYVGGGFGRSVHSLLEPYLAGTKVFCGPRVHRSTEYDLILSQSPFSLVVVEKAKSFQKVFEANALDGARLKSENIIAPHKDLMEKFEDHLDYFIKGDDSAV